LVSLSKLRSGGAIDIDSASAAKRWILKSLWEHASVGLDATSVIATSDSAVILRELESRLDRLGGDGFAEQYIDGREFNISLLDGGQEVAPGASAPQVLPPAEIVFHNTDKWRDRPRIVNYDCKWNEESFEYQNTERVLDFGKDDVPLLERLADIARQCWMTFELRGYARVDFRVDAEGRPWVLEVNTNPCLSPDAGFAAAIDRAGISYPTAINRIVNEVLNRSRLCLPAQP
jgi:D-alanine-D-alanine ligase